MNREDFPLLNDKTIYFDSGATTLKPKAVIDKMLDYYYKYPSNIHRGDYEIGRLASLEYEMVRSKVKKFINASKDEEIIFTAGTTDSLNKIVFGFMEDYLNEEDEVLITKAEHASNILPWLILAKKKKIVVKYLPLNLNHELEFETVEDAINEKTKVISLAYITNVVGDIRPIEEIGRLCQEKGIIFVVDGAQSVPHLKTDVIKDNIDFLAFSSHKMLGPTGVGVLYGKMKYLEGMRPFTYGGGMNESFDAEGKITYQEIPTRFEAGTPAVGEVIGLGKAIDYLNKIGMDNIYQHELELKDYLFNKIKDIKDLTIYNKNSKSGILTFNLDGIFSGDTALYLDQHNICIRAGNHCAKALKDELNIKNTCRVSLYFYNTKEEIDKLVDLLKNSKELYKINL